MDFLTVGKKIGELEVLLASIDCGTLETKKNTTNKRIKQKSLQLLKELQEELKYK